MRKIYYTTGSIAFVVVAATLLFLDWLSRRASDRFMYKNLKIDEMNSHTFSAQSEAHLATCHASLQLLAREILKEMDIAVLCGHRSEAEQSAAYLSGSSKLQFPQSKHNNFPSNAVDIAPYPVDWNDLSRFQQMGEIAKQKAAMLGISMRWGGDWFAFKDYPHIELA
jgi:peptidoglycan L-alanyl-D-glutamate endopeptidase CwlK